MGEYAVDVKNEWLDNLTNVTLYLAIFVGDPDDAGVEISGANYARKAVAPSDWSAASNGFITNLNDVAFDKATGVWSADDVTHIAFYDAASGGNLKWKDDLPEEQQQPIVENNTVEFPAGDLDLSISNAA